MSLIENLRALHAVDSQVRGIRTRVENAERDVRRHQPQLDTLAKQLASSEKISLDEAFLKVLATEKGKALYNQSCAVA